MLEGFDAIKVRNQDKTITASYERIPIEELAPGEVLIKIHHSSLNYKDALAITGEGAILKSFPMIPGIDLAGEVLESKNPGYHIGHKVLITGCGLGETHDGGFAKLARVPSEWIVPLPEGLTLKESMIIGTAGFTAALAAHRLIENHQTPEKGPIVVTGASGGVGNFSVALMNKLGFEVIAITSKQSNHDFLTSIGAHKVMSLDELGLGNKPLTKARFGGAIDNLGGPVLSGLLAATSLWGNVASIGLAMNASLSTTVFPHILRGVSLLGISSANCPYTLRRDLWQKLATHWRLPLEQILERTISLQQLPQAARDMIDQKTKGRILVDCQS